MLLLGNLLEVVSGKGASIKISQRARGAWPTRFSNCNIFSLMLSRRARLIKQNNSRNRTQSNSELFRCNKNYRLNYLLFFLLRAGALLISVKIWTFHCNTPSEACTVIVFVESRLSAHSCTRWISLWQRGSTKMRPNIYWSNLRTASKSALNDENTRVSDNGMYSRYAEVQELL